MGKYDYEATGFEMVYNSIIPLQQMLGRARRVYHDDTVDFWDKEGFGDMSIVPILGLFDDERHDVSIDEIKKGYGIKGTGWKTDLATAILTDPASFLTSGGSVLFKAAAKGIKVLRGSAMTKQLASVNLSARAIAEGTATISNKVFLENIDKVLGQARLGLGKGGKGLWRQRRALKQTRDSLLRSVKNGTVKLSDDFIHTADVARKSEVFIGLPFGMGPRGARFIVDTESRFWTSYLASTARSGAKIATAPAIRAAAPAIAGIASRFPQIGNTFGHVADMGKMAYGASVGKVTGRLGAFGTGTKWGRYGEHITTSNLDPARMAKLAEKNSTDANRLFNGLINPDTSVSRRVSSVIKDFRTIITKEGPEAFKRAFLKAVENGRGGNPASISQPLVGSATLDEKFAKTIRALVGPISAEDLAKLGPDDMVAILNGNVARFRREWKAASKAMEGSFNQIVLSTSGKFKAGLTEAEKDWYSWGRAFRQKIAIGFKPGGELMELDKANKLLNISRSQATNQLMAVGQKLMGMQVEDAMKLGIEPEKFESFMMGVAQGTPRMEEITQYIKLLNKGGLNADDYSKLSNSINNFLLRMTSLIDSGTIKAGSGRDTEIWRQLIDELGTRYASNVKYGDTLTSPKYPSSRWNPTVSAADSMGGGAKNKVVVPKGLGTNSGKFLGELTDDELIAVTEKLAKKMPQAKMTSAKLDKFYAGNPAIRNLQKAWGINAESMHKMLLKAQTGSPSMIVSHSGIPGTKARTVGKMSAEESIELQKLAKGEIAPKLGKDKRKLPAWAKVLDDDIDEIRKLRDAGKDKVRTPVKPVQTESGAARVPDVIDVTRKKGGEAIEVNDFGLAIGRLAAAREELKRIGKLGDEASIGPAFIRELETSLEMVNKTWDDAVYGILKPKGATKYMEAIRDIQRATLIKAVEHGNFTIGMPFAYVGRIFSNAESQTLRKMVVRAGKEDSVQAIIPMLNSNLARGWDSVTLEELNDFYHAVKSGTVKESAAVNSFADEFERVSKSIGFELNSKTNKFVDTLFHPTVHRHAQALKESSNIIYTKAALEAMTEAGTGFAGKIIGHVKDGKKHIFGSRRKTVAELKDYETKIGVEVERLTGESTGILLQEASGELRLLPMNSFTQGGFQGIILDEGDDIGALLGLRATRGDLTHGDIIADRLSAGGLKDLEGKNLVYGDKGVVEGIFNSMANMHKHSGSVGILLDHVQFMIKKFQTVLRPAFTVSNIASLPAQLMVIGVKPLEAMGGISDAFRWMATDLETIGRYERVGVHAGSKKGFFSGSKKNINLNFLEDVDAMGLDSIARLTPEELFAKYGDDFNLGDMEYHLGNGMVLNMEEMMMSWAESNMFSNFTREGLTGNQGVTYSTIQIWNRALGKTAQATDLPGHLLNVAKTAEKIPIAGKPIIGIGAWYGRNVTKMAEASEVFVRLTAYFAEIRMGKTMMEAAESAKIAAVDYSNLTRFERTVMKRVIPYYTFPRHFLPAAAKYYAEAPSRMATQAHLISHGPWREQRGRLMYDFEAGGKERAFDATRMLPTLEALKTLETVSEFFINTTRRVGIGHGAASRREGLSQGTPFPMTAGSLVTAGYTAISGDTDESFLSELSDAFWVNRFIYSAEDPLGEETMLTKARNIIVPLRDRDRRQEQAMIKRRFRLMSKGLENKILRAREDRDYELRDSLMAERGRLAEKAREMLREVVSA